MEAKDRITALLEYLGMSKHEFERVCGLSNGYVGKISKSIGYKGLEKILEHFPQINKTWLQTGEGEMIKSNTQNSTIISGTGNINNNSVNSPIENSIFHCCNDENASVEIENLKKQVEELRDKCNILCDANKNLINEKQFYQEHIKQLMSMLNKKDYDETK
ncbi:MAG: hypothetical protein ACI4E1_10165 [Lachnospira sp.]